MTNQQITMAQWLSELAKIEASKHGRGATGMTTREIQDALGVSPGKARDVVRLAISEGRCIVRAKTAPSICGAMRSIPVYEFLGPRKGKK